MTDIKLERRWSLGSQIGGGGFGRVFEAVAEDGQKAAAKLVAKMAGADRELLFVDLGDVRNVVPVIDSGATEADWVLVMPLAQKSLRQHLDDRGAALAVDEGVEILTDVVKTLSDLERRGIVHRDIKPENVLYFDGHWCLADFGIARYAEQTTAADTWKYAWSGAYNPPERWRDERATNASDIYSFGIMAYEVLAGHRPFDVPDLRDKHLTIDPAPPPVQSSLCSIILECLNKSPQARPSAANLAPRLEKSVREATGAAARLQAANQAAVIAQSKASTAEAAERQELTRRTGLASAAGLSLRAIADLCSEQLAEHAPAARLDRRPESLLIAQLGHAILSISDVAPISPTAWGPWPPKFDVVAKSRIQIDIPRSSHGYAGRSHSLWFCDCQQEGHYRWFEIAFWIMANSIPDHQPFGLDPGKEAGEALAPVLGLYNIARGPTPIDQGEEGAFLDLWLNWFGKASLGELSMPGGMPETSNPVFRR